jgi:EpsI family protein
MRSGGLRAYTPALVLFAGCLLLFQGTRDQQTVPLAGSLKTILPQVGTYRVEDQVVGDEERRIAGMSDYVARIYWQDTTPMFTTYVGYYERQTQGKSIHSPRNCLPGAGWQIVRPGTATVVAAGGPQVVNRYVLKNGSSLAITYYWYQGRGRVVASEYAVKLNLLRDAALVGHTEEALVRLVVLVDPADTAQTKADALAMRIAPRLMNEVGKVLPRGDAPSPPPVALALP